MKVIFGLAAALLSLCSAANIRAGAVATRQEQQKRHAQRSLRQSIIGPLERLCVLRGGASNVEHTYAMLKPDIASDDAKVSAIKDMIDAAGLTIEREQKCKLSQKQCEEFYEEHRERAFFKDLVKFMRSGPVIKLELSGQNAILAWRELIGPTSTATAREKAPNSVRAQFGTDNTRNAAHGSDAPESAERELAFMFPED